jgi:hypothetical protein
VESGGVRHGEVDIGGATTECAVAANVSDGRVRDLNPCPGFRVRRVGQRLLGQVGR